MLPLHFQDMISLNHKFKYQQTIGWSNVHEYVILKSMNPWIILEHVFDFLPWIVLEHVFLMKTPTLVPTRITITQCVQIYMQDQGFCLPM